MLDPTSREPSPSTQNEAKFIGIILGADDWPKMPTLMASPAFKRSRDRIKGYMTEELGLKDGDTLLDLFNSDAPQPETDGQIREFLARHSREGTPDFTDLILYYTGHGDFTRQDQRFQVVLRSTNNEQKDFTGYQMRYLAGALNEYARHARKLIVLDCCYARAAFPDFQLQAGEALEDVVPEKIRQEAKLQLPDNSGTVLLCAASEDQWGFVPEFERHNMENTNDLLTMFTYGLANAMVRGIDDGGQYLNIEQIFDKTCELISSRFPEHFVKPILDAPKGDRQALFSVPLFPNPAKTVSAEEMRLRKLEHGLEKVGMIMNGLERRFEKSTRYLETIKSDITSNSATSVENFLKISDLSEIPHDLEDFYFLSTREKEQMEQIEIPDALIYWLRKYRDAKMAGDKAVFVVFFFFLSACVFIGPMEGLKYVQEPGPSAPMIESLDVLLGLSASGVFLLCLLMWSLINSRSFVEIVEERRQMEEGVKGREVGGKLGFVLGGVHHPFFDTNLDLMAFAAMAARQSGVVARAIESRIFSVLGVPFTQHAALAAAVMLGFGITLSVVSF